MDSSAKGGGALTACAETKAPVYLQDFWEEAILILLWKRLNP
jgi:signal recognition particle GTPase